MIESDWPPTYWDLQELEAPPNIVMLRDSNDERHGRWHAVWMLDHPVREDHPAEVRFRDDVRKSLVKALGGDPNFTFFLSRNPFHEGGPYRTHFLHDHKWELSELSSACASLHPSSRNAPEVSSAQLPGSPSSKGNPGSWLMHPDPEEGTIARNSSLFRNAIRPFMDQAASGRTVQVGSVRKYLDGLNRQLRTMDPRGRLEDRELQGIAESVARRCSNDALVRKHVNYRRASSGQGGSRYTPLQRSKGGRTRASQPAAAEARERGLRSGRSTQVATHQQLAAEARVLAEEGITLKQIAAKIGRSERRVAQYLAETFTPVLHERDQLKIRARRLRAEGQTLRAIADQLGRSPATILVWTREAEESLDPYQDEDLKDSLTPVGGSSSGIPTGFPRSKHGSGQDAEPLGEDDDSAIQEGPSDALSDDLRARKASGVRDDARRDPGDLRNAQDEQERHALPDPREPIQDSDPARIVNPQREE